jgi:hypothetical protein
MESALKYTKEIPFGPGPADKWAKKDIIQNQPDQTFRFLQFPFWLVYHPALTFLQPKSLRIYLYLLARAGRDGNGYVYNEQVIRDIGVSPNHLIDYFTQLDNLGLIDLVANNRKLKYKKYKINREEPERIKPKKETENNGNTLTPIPKRL